jgi:hypothetical protein
MRRIRDDRRISDISVERWFVERRDRGAALLPDWRPPHANESALGRCAVGGGRGGGYIILTSYVGLAR